MTFIRQASLPSASTPPARQACRYLEPGWFRATWEPYVGQESPISLKPYRQSIAPSRHFKPWRPFKPSQDFGPPSLLAASDPFSSSPAPLSHTMIHRGQRHCTYMYRQSRPSLCCTDVITRLTHTHTHTHTQGARARTHTMASFLASSSLVLDRKKETTLKTSPQKRDMMPSPYLLGPWNTYTPLSQTDTPGPTSGTTRGVVPSQEKPGPNRVHEEREKRPKKRKRTVWY